MKVIRGTNVYPRAIEGIVREYPEIAECQSVITHEGIRDEITLRLEMRPGWPAGSWAGLADADAGVRASLALIHNIVSGLALEYEHLSDLGT